MNDKIFGEVEYKDGAWKRDETIEVYGKSRDITIEIRADRQDASLEVQKKAYQSFLSHREQYLQQMPKVFLAEYLYNYEDIQSRVMFSENSPLLKENINEVVIMQTVAPLVLYFDTTGDYGWICKCGWTRDRAQAILLSGKEPRILTPDQLRNLHKRNDDTFGLLVHDCKNAWRGLTKHSFFGEEENLVIELEGSVEDGITEEQKKAYSEYLEKEDELFKRFMEVLQASEKKGTALPKTLYIDIEGNYGWICYAQWNKRYIGVLLSEETPRILKTNQLLKYRKRNSPVVLEDFKNEETHSYGIGYVWGNEIDIDVYRKDHSLEAMLPLINKLVEFLNHHKDAFVKALIGDGMLALAEEWVSSCEDEAEDSTEERRGYMVDDETAVYLPISEKDFAASLEFDTIDISYDEEADDISACIYIDCDPDYFAGHSIEIYMDSKGKIEIIGLAG